MADSSSSWRKIGRSLIGRCWRYINHDAAHRWVFGVGLAVVGIVLGELAAHQILHRVEEIPTKQEFNARFDKAEERLAGLSGYITQEILSRLNAKYGDDSSSTGLASVCKGGAAYSLDSTIAACTRMIDSTKPKRERLLAFVGRAVALLDREKFENAISDLNEAINLFDNDAALYGLRSMIFALLKNYNRAMSDADRSVELDGTSAIGYIARANTCLLRQDGNRALADAERAVQLEVNVATLVSRGLAYWISGNAERAVSDLGAAIDLDPSNPKLYLLRSMASLEHQPQALADVNTAMKLTRKDDARFLASCYAQRSFIFWTANDKQSAFDDANLAVKLNNESSLAYRVRSLIYWSYNESTKTDGLDLALSDIANAVRYDPLDWLNYEIRGDIYFERGEFGHAIDDYSTGLKIGPPNDDTIKIYLKRADAYARKTARSREDLIAAAADFSEVIIRNPSNAEYYAARAAIYMDLGETNNALADIKKGLNLEPLNVSLQTLRNVVRQKRSTPK